MWIPDLETGVLRVTYGVDVESCGLYLIRSFGTSLLFCYYEVLAIRYLYLYRSLYVTRQKRHVRGTAVAHTTVTSRSHFTCYLYLVHHVHDEYMYMNMIILT